MTSDPAACYLTANHTHRCGSDIDIQDRGLDIYVDGHMVKLSPAVKRTINSQLSP